VPASEAQTWRWTVAALLALVCAACATAPSTTPVMAQQMAGRDFVERACAGCHATGAAGASRNPDAPPFRELARTRTDAALANALDEVSRQGHVQMPPVYVTPAERQQVLAYLRSLRLRTDAGNLRAAAMRGREFALSHCAGCHAVGPQGVSRYPAAPPFRSLAQAWSPIALQLRLERSPLHDGADMPPRQLSAGQADDIAAYIQALQAGQDLGRPVFTGPICHPTYWC
jgi:mono/diheme cytochrome c family protein